MATHRVLLVCLQGAAKRVIAAEPLGHTAAACGLDVVADAAGVQPVAEIPPRVVDALLEEGIDVRGRHPVGVTAEAVAAEHHVLSFRCDPGAVADTGLEVMTWHDVPAVSEDHAGPRAAIADPLAPFAERLMTTAPSAGAGPR